MKRHAALLALGLSLFLQSCSFLPLGTSVWIQRKLENVPVGSTKQQVAGELGVPHFKIRFDRGHSPAEVWGYTLGHYWHHEEINLLFHENKLVRMTTNPYELVEALDQIGVVEASSFWRLNPE